MICAFHNDLVCSRFGATVEEVQAAILSDEGHKSGEYTLRECEFRTDVREVSAQLLKFRPGIVAKFKKGISFQRAA